MSEYIDKGELIKFLQEARLRLPHDSKDFHTRDLMLLNFEQYVTLMSAADVAEVRHGEWGIEITEYSNCMICSECNFGYPHIDFNYCPNCGAKMDLGDDE